MGNPSGSSSHLPCKAEEFFCYTLGKREQKFHATEAKKEGRPHALMAGRPPYFKYILT